VEKIDDPSIGAVIFNQAIEPIATGPATFVAGDIHYGELADEIAEIGWALGRISRLCRMVRSRLFAKLAWSATSAAADARPIHRLTRPPKSKPSAMAG
jgi:hypothetical protein